MILQFPVFTSTVTFKLTHQYKCMELAFHSSSIQIQVGFLQEHDCPFQTLLQFQQLKKKFPSLNLRQSPSSGDSGKKIFLNQFSLFSDISR